MGVLKSLHSVWCLARIHIALTMAKIALRLCKSEAGMVFQLTVFQDLDGHKTMEISKITAPGLAEIKAREYRNDPRMLALKGHTRSEINSIGGVRYVVWGPTEVGEEAHEKEESRS